MTGLQRARHLLRLFLPLVSLQALTQVTSALAGLLVVRRLPLPDFAVYAIAVSVQASLTVLSDVGTSALFVARAGTFHTEPGRLAELANTARALRTRLLVLVLLLAGPLLWWSLRSSQPSFLDWIFIVVLVALTVACQVSASLDGTIALAMLKPEKQQLGLLLSAALRLACFATILVIVPRFQAALVLNLAGALLQALYIRKFANSLLPPSRARNAEDRRAFLGVIRGQALNAVYFAFSSQITLWLVGVLSSSKVVAQVGALGRLSNLIVLAQSALLGVVAPRFARYRDPGVLLRRYVAVVAMGLAGATVLLGLAAEMPGVLLWLIGPKYSNLGPYLTLAMASTLTYTLALTVYGLNASRAWIDEAWIAIPLTIALQAWCLITLDISRIRDALIFGWAGAIPSLLVQLVVAVRRFRLEFTRVRLPTTGS